MSDHELNTCGCCEGIEVLTPAPVSNAPGLSALAWRVGTHATFKESMLTSASKEYGPGTYTARDDSETGVAIIDAWSVALDVLTFYQEQVANEGYLRTATERRSVLELARSIGYELRPGVAASTFLAFTVKNGSAAADGVRIEVGTKAQSIPGQDEKPQIFETVEDVVAQEEWNAIQAREYDVQTVDQHTTDVWLEGTGVPVVKGDLLLFVWNVPENWVGNSHSVMRRAVSVEVDREKRLTKITLDTSLEPLEIGPDTSVDRISLYVLRDRASLFGHNAPDWRLMPDEVRVAFGAGLFDDKGIPELDGEDNHKADPQITEWPGFTISEISGTPDEPAEVLNNQYEYYLHLDEIYPKIVAGSYVVLTIPEKQVVYLVSEAVEDVKTNFTLTTKTTRLRIQGPELPSCFDDAVRQVVVFAWTEPLEFGRVPVAAPVAGTSVNVVPDESLEKIGAGRLIALTGRDWITGESRSEVMEIDQVESSAQEAALYFTEALKGVYSRESVRINANVVRATHGETRTEVLGDGNAAQPFQTFELKNIPLTYVPASVPSGAKGTLQVRVNEILWGEAEDFYQRSTSDEIYTVRHADDGTATVMFGDGKTGTALPTGQENVGAQYRVGIGREGMVKAEQISLLLTRSFGLKGVVNPTAPSGAADPDALEDARINAPLTVLTLDRVVSLRDYEDFARAFSGVAKAVAVRTWSGERRIVHLTVAGLDGLTILPNSDLYRNLIDGINAARYADRAVMVGSFEPLFFNVEAKVLIDPRYVAEDVFTHVESDLLEQYSFAARSFGQGVTSSEILATIQSVEGVLAVDLDGLYLTTPTNISSLEHRIPAYPARWESGTIHSAQLLRINTNPDGIQLTEMTQ